MIFYSGFSLREEGHFFDEFIKKSDYTVAGFSYGAIKAAQYTAKSYERIDTLQLFSPAFFQTKKESFRRLQMGGYLKDSEAYMEKFVENCFSPCECEPILRSEHDADKLYELLYFEWGSELIHSILEKGTQIEVYLGLDDRVIDVAGAREFFIPYATVTSIKRANHFLQECI